VRVKIAYKLETVWISKRMKLELSRRSPNVSRVQRAYVPTEWYSTDMGILGPIGFRLILPSSVRTMNLVTIHTRHKGKSVIVFSLLKIVLEFLVEMRLRMLAEFVMAITRAVKIVPVLLTGMLN